MGCFRFFRRQELSFRPVQEVNWQIVEPSNYDAYLFAPVVDGMWRQHELWDGTYSLEDLLDAHEVMTVRAENERRAREQAKLESEMQRG